ncbi:MAG: exodeoxyribonuclease VII small subunit [Terriglobales bacterium]
MAPKTSAPGALEPTTPLSFEQCVARLEEIVTQLERTDLPLETSIALFEEGMALSQSCRQQLDAAEGKVEQLIRRDGKMVAEPFVLEHDK